MVLTSRIIIISLDILLFFTLGEKDRTFMISTQNTETPRKYVKSEKVWNFTKITENVLGKPLVSQGILTTYGPRGAQVVEFSKI